MIVSAEDGPDVWDTLLAERHGVQPMAAASARATRCAWKPACRSTATRSTRTTNPFEAGLGRVVKLAKGDFAGSKALTEISERGVERRLVAFQLTAGGVPRQGYPILDGADGRRAGDQRQRLARASARRSGWRTSRTASRNRTLRSPSRFVGSRSRLRS